MTLLTKRDLLLVGGAALASPAAAWGQVATGNTAFVSRHQGRFNGVSIDYVATVGETVLKGADGQPVARLVTTSYVAEGADPAHRPVLFAFNGGPSAASATLHMLALGPKRLPIAQDVNAPKPAGALIDNPLTVLDVADLVFVDPAETGFSRILASGRRESFYSVNGDAQSISDLILAWTRANGREGSPKYVLGESYGTIRAAVMAGQLADIAPLAGVVLFGQGVNMIETSQRAKNALAYATNLPALAAAAKFHGRSRYLGMSLPALVDHSYAWGMGEYLQALVRGGDLPAGERRRIAGELEALTGVSAGYYLEHDLAITKIAFAGELLRDRGLVLSAYDSRMTAPAPKPGKPFVDPIFQVVAAVTPAARRYLAADLGVTWPHADYRRAAPDTDGWAWNGTLDPGGPFLDFDYQAGLSKAFRANPRFRLMIATGYHDLTTTIGPARYLVTRSDYPRDRVRQRQYVGGHIAYIAEPSLRAFTGDLRAFLTGV